LQSIDETLDDSYVIRLGIVVATGKINARIVPLLI
jgi:hypothetical protein